MSFMEKLLTDIERDTLQTAPITGIKHIDKRVLNAIKNTDRKAFVRPQDSNLAYQDIPLEIGFSQTISQPFIVALMINLIEPQQQDKVLEVGSGSGYVTAVLSKLCREVFGIEVIAKLAERSQQTIKELNITNVHIVSADGRVGLPSHAPFDKIIISAATHKLPDILLDQLAIGGILVFPKNLSPFEQMLVRIKKMSSCEFTLHDILPVRFVPLVNTCSSL